MSNSHSSPSFENASSLGNPSLELGTVPNDESIWGNLKAAIAASSGFQRWHLERSLDGRLSGLSLDHLVQRYLRETLETLAY